MFENEKNLVEGHFEMKEGKISYWDVKLKMPFKIVISGLIDVAPMWESETECVMSYT